MGKSQYIYNKLSYYIAIIVRALLLASKPAAVPGIYNLFNFIVNILMDIHACYDQLTGVKTVSAGPSATLG